MGFIGIIPDTRAKPEKFDRIEGNLEPLNRLGKLVLNIDEKDNPHMKRLEEQFKLVNRSMKSPADGPDDGRPDRCSSTTHGAASSGMVMRLKTAQISRAPR